MGIRITIIFYCFSTPDSSDNDDEDNYLENNNDNDYLLLQHTGLFWSLTLAHLLQVALS